MAESITVYSFRRCPFAMRVRLVLHEKGLAFQTQEEDLKNLSPRLRELHPEARVPVLVHGNRVIYESAIITEYLEEAFPETLPLMPRAAGSRAEVRLWTHWCNQIFKPDVDRLKYGKARFPEAQCQGIEAKIIEHLQKTETALGSSPWLVENQFSLADIHLFPFCRQLLRITPTPEFLSQFPKTTAWVSGCEARPSFGKAMEKLAP